MDETSSLIQKVAPPLSCYYAELIRGECFQAQASWRTRGLGLVLGMLAGMREVLRTSPAAHQVCNSPSDASYCTLNPDSVCLIYIYSTGFCRLVELAADAAYCGGCFDCVHVRGRGL